MKKGDNIMKMKKKSLAMMLSIVMIMSVGNIAQADTKSGSLSGHAVTGSSSINSSGASASTGMGISPTAGASVSVAATYSYVNVMTLATGSSNNGSGGTNACSVSFYAPTNCRSVQISASHSAYYDSQSWSASTYEIY